MFIEKWLEILTAMTCPSRVNNSNKVHLLFEHTFQKWSTLRLKGPVHPKRKLFPLTYAVISSYMRPLHNGLLPRVTGSWLTEVLALWMLQASNILPHGHISRVCLSVVICRAQTQTQHLEFPNHIFECEQTCIKALTGLPLCVCALSK